MKKIGVLASGRGTNLQSIVKAEERGELAGKVVIVISDRREAYALEYAREKGIKSVYLNPKEFSNREEFDRVMLEQLKNEKVDLVVMAGFMRLLSPLMIEAFPNRIMNIHPALLPAFPGMNGVKQALEYGVKVSGCTVHFVDEGLDTGPIILQEVVPVFPEDTEDTLHERIQTVEHRKYPRAIDLYCRGFLNVEGRRCFIYEPEEQNSAD